MTSPWSRRIAPFACIVAVMALVCCKRDAGDESEPGAALRGGHRAGVAVLMDTRGNPERFTQAEYLQAFARPRPGVRLVIYDAQGSAAIQQRQLEEAAADKPEFVMVFPIDDKVLSAKLSALKRAGTTVIAFDTVLAQESCTARVIKDEKAIGRAAGEFLITALRQKAADEGRNPVTGRIVRLTESDERTFKARDKGLADALAKESGIVIVHEAPCGNIGAEIPQRLDEIIRLQKEFDVILADNDYIADAAAETLAARSPDLREKTLVMGIGGAFGAHGGIGLVVDSKIDATVYNPPLVDVAWSLVMQAIEEPAFHLKPSYEVQPFAIGLEKALDLARFGRIDPDIR